MARFGAGIAFFFVFALAAAFAVTSARAQVTPVTITVSADWPLIPKNAQGESRVDDGGHFRLLFVSSTQRDATADNIGAYNTFIQNLITANGHAAIQEHASDYRVVAGRRSVGGAVSARVNTYTDYVDGDGTGHPIYWLNGPPVATDYENFWEQTSWGARSAYRLETGTRPVPEYTGNDLRVWTGTRAGSYTIDPDDGKTAPGALHTNGLGENKPGEGRPLFGIMGNPASLGRNSWVVVSQGGVPSTTNYRLYGLSPVYKLDMIPTEVVSATFQPELFEVGVTVTLSLEFNEQVSGLTAGEITLSGDVSVTMALQPADTATTTSYLLPFTASGPGPVTVSLNARSVEDAAGNLGPMEAFMTTSLRGLRPKETVDAAKQALEEFGQAVSAQSAAIVGDRLFSSGALASSSLTAAPSSSLRLRLAGREFDLAGMGSRGGLDEGDRDWMEIGELTGDSDDWADSAFELSSTRAGGRFQSVWGRGVLTKFKSGNAEDDGKLDGKVVSGYLGAEFGTPDRLAGVALSRSSGDGDYKTVDPDDADAAARKAKVDLDMTAVHPYARWRLDRKLSVWGSLGLGRGEMTIKDDGPVTRADLELQSLAVGLVGEMETSGDVELAVKGDYTYTRLESKDRTEDEVNLSARYGTKRFRVALEAAMEQELPGAATLRPSLELAGRIDDGDSQEGLGVEIGAGVEYAQAGFAADLHVNLLVAHEEDNLESWGVSGGLRYSPSLGSTGLSAGFSAGLGREADMEGLYEDGLARLADADEESDEDEEGEDPASFRYTMDLGYGLVVRRLGLFRPYASLSATSSSGVLGSGFELKLPGYGAATFGLRGERDLDDGDGLVEFTIETEL